MIYPLKVLQIETTNLCNSQCEFCIHKDLHKMGVKFGTMSDKLFDKVLKDALEFSELEVIVPMLLGEPLLDKKIILRMKKINKMLPGIKIKLFTNCSLLTPEIVKKLQKIDNLTMNFSLNGINKETRKELMGLDDFSKCADMIDLYVQSGRKHIVTIVQNPEVSKEEVLEFAKSKPDWDIGIIPYKNWSGDKFNATRQTHCHRAIAQMPIMWDGKVNLCCMEYGKVIFGDVNKQSLKEIWESKYRQMYCNAHFKGEYLKGVCANCTRG